MGWRAGLRWGDPGCRWKAHQAPFRQLPLIPCRREEGKMKGLSGDLTCTVEGGIDSEGMGVARWWRLGLHGAI